jgi:hypothetical protein
MSDEPAMTESAAAMRLLSHLGVSLSEPRGTSGRGPGCDWARAARTAALHEVEPLLYALIGPHVDRLGVPPDVLRQLREVHCCSQLRNTLLYRSLAGVLTALARSGIEVAVLKGAYIAEAVYGNVALRPMGDIDLLARAGDVARVPAVLTGLGYVPFLGEGPGTPDYGEHHHLPPFVRAGAPPIELHRALAPRGSPFRIDVDGLWARSREVEIAGVAVRALAPEDLLLHLCQHVSYNHRFRASLLSLFDIALVLERFRDELDWSRVVALASEDGRSRFVRCTLLLVRRMLDGEVPREALEGLGHGAADHRIVETARRYILDPAPDPPATYRGMVEEAGGVGRKLVRLAWGLFPEPVRLRSIYGLPPGSRRVYLYYLYRPWDLLVRRGRTVAELVLRSERQRDVLQAEERRRRIHRWVEGAE